MAPSLISGFISLSYRPSLDSTAVCQSRSHCDEVSTASRSPSNCLWVYELISNALTRLPISHEIALHELAGYETGYWPE